MSQAHLGQPFTLFKQHQSDAFYGPGRYPAHWFTVTVQDFVSGDPRGSPPQRPMITELTATAPAGNFRICVSRRSPNFAVLKSRCAKFVENPEQFPAGPPVTGCGFYIAYSTRTFEAEEFTTLSARRFIEFTNYPVAGFRTICQAIADMK